MADSIPAIPFKDRLKFGFQTNRVKILFLAHLLVVLSVIFIGLYIKSFVFYRVSAVASIFIGATFVALALKQKLLPIVAVLISFLIFDRAVTGTDFEKQQLAVTVCDYTLSSYCFLLILLEGKDAWQRQQKCLMSWMTLYFLGIALPLWNVPFSEWLMQANMPFYGMGIMYLGATIWERIKSSE